MRDFCVCGGMYVLSDTADSWVFTCNNCGGRVEISDRAFDMDANLEGPVG